MRRAACSTAAPRASAGRRQRELPIAIDGAQPGMTARTGNGVFETRVAQQHRRRWIDAGTVVDPSALTGSTYDIQFSVAPAQTTYSVLKDGVATAQANVAYRPARRSRSTAWR
jgi:flagellar hook-associated protein 3 FlgL